MASKLLVLYLAAASTEQIAKLKNMDNRNKKTLALHNALNVHLLSSQLIQCLFTAPLGIRY